MKKKKEPGVYRFLRPIVSFLFKLLYRPTIIGKENIPKEGRVVICSNHMNNLDCIIIIASTKRCIHFLAKDELFNSKMGWFFRGLGLIPVNRRTKDGNALAKAIEYLNDDKTIGIFPEGTFNKSNDPILPFKIGAVKMAHDTNTVIVPCVLKGKYKIFRKSITAEYFEPISIDTDNLDDANKMLMDFYSSELDDREV